MKPSIFATFFLLAFLSASCLHSDTIETGNRESGIVLSDELAELLRAEMREIATGVQQIPLALAAADWALIQKTSSQISASYIMKRSLTSAQAAELKHTLPEAFKKLDAQFHARAEKLGDAAARQDYEQVAFQFSRLVESCAVCHSTFASKRFPGFRPPAATDHHH